MQLLANEKGLFISRARHQAGALTSRYVYISQAWKRLNARFVAVFLYRFPSCLLSSIEILVEMTKGVGKHEAETALWEYYRALLEFLFIVQNRAVPEVRDIMAKCCDFDRKWAAPFRL